jgi:hypothetical protein
MEVIPASHRLTRSRIATHLHRSLGPAGSVWPFCVREFRHQRGRLGWLEAVRRSKGPTVFTVLFEDSAALIGLVIALIGIALAEILEMPRLDGIASLGIGVVLAATAAFLAFESQSLLTGEAVHPEMRAEIERIAKMAPGVVGTNQVLTMHFGPHEVLAALSPMSRRRSPVSSARSRQRSPKSPASLSRPRTATPRARWKRRCSLAAETTWFGVAHATNLHHSRGHPPGVKQRARAHRSDGPYRRNLLVAARSGEATDEVRSTPV